MLPKEERKAMLLRLFNDETELVDHAKDRERLAAEKRAEKAESDAMDEDVKKEVKTEPEEENKTEVQSEGAKEGGVSLPVEMPTNGAVQAEAAVAETEGGVKLEGESNGVKAEGETS